MDDESAALLEAIGRDPWEAITRPLPAQADMDTLTLIIELAMVCGLIGRDVDNPNGATGMSRADAEAFTARLVELGCRLETADRARGRSVL